MGTLIAAILAGRLHCNASSLATLDGRDVIATAHALPSGEKHTLLVALWTDEAIKQLLGIVLINTNTRAMIPVLATAVTIYHHTMIIGTTADTIFTTIVTFGVRGSRIHLTGWLAGALGVRRAGFLC
jgi:hypothetical protein